ncbi:hypothetical protein ACUXST_000052 [Sphingomonas sp. F9_3S_D5_B_2]
MPDRLLPPGVAPPDFYIAAMGRSGSTMLCNWLSRPPEQLVFVEPFFTRTANPRLLRIQLEDFGMGASEQEWLAPAGNAKERFRELMAPRLRGRRWAFKEVLCEEHFRVIDAFRPQRVLITVRNIADVALSFFEKHRLQGNLERFDDDWVAQYCVREAQGLVALRDMLRELDLPFEVVRYEDFTSSVTVQQQVTEFVGWTPGARVDAHMERFDRGFEVERHGSDISPDRRAPQERGLESGLMERAAEIGRRCAGYQAVFGYA